MAATCTVDECESPQRTRNLCSAHYARTRRGTDLRVPLRPFAPGAVCCVPDCDRLAKSHGMCPMHVRRVGKHGNPSTVSKGHPGYGAEHPGWLGDSVGYKSAHLRVKRARGPASAHPCAHCSAPAQEWAYDHQDPSPLTGHYNGYTVTYSGDPNHYQPLCVPCHRATDAHHRKVG
jgi:hypothetical protein